jgi:hypothetical protein
MKDVFDSLLKQSNGSIKGFCFGVAKNLESRLNGMSEHKGNQIIVLSLAPNDSVIYAKYTDIYDKDNL